MGATPVWSTGWHCGTVSRLHRKCGRTDLRECSATAFPVLEVSLGGKEILEHQLYHRFGDKIGVLGEEYESNCIA
jgi:hypothetical protein